LQGFFSSLKFSAASLGGRYEMHLYKHLILFLHSWRFCRFEFNLANPPPPPATAGGEGISRQCQ